jgi:hypothetical protein
MLKLKIELRELKKFLGKTPYTQSHAIGIGVGAPTPNEPLVVLDCPIPHGKGIFK